MQLRNNDALSAINDKCAIVCHERNLAHVNILFFDVFDRLGRRFLVVNDETYFDAKRACVGGAAQNTFFNVENGGAQRVIHILQRRAAAVARNREH